jgi:hypothetical protein
MARRRDNGGRVDDIFRRLDGKQLGRAAVGATRRALGAAYEGSPIDTEDARRVARRAAELVPDLRRKFLEVVGAGTRAQVAAALAAPAVLSVRLAAITLRRSARAERSADTEQLADATAATADAAANVALAEREKARELLGLDPLPAVLVEALQPASGADEALLADALSRCARLAGGAMSVADVLLSATRIGGTPSCVQPDLTYDQALDILVSSLDMLKAVHATGELPAELQCLFDAPVPGSSPGRA